MKLISNVPIQILISLNLSRQKFWTAKSYMAYGERLKILEQRLFFLKRCRSHRIIPKFIETSINVNLSTLFPVSTPLEVNEHLTP